MLTWNRTLTLAWELRAGRCSTAAGMLQMEEQQRSLEEILSRTTAYEESLKLFCRDQLTASHMRSPSSWFSKYFDVVTLESKRL